MPKKPGKNTVRSKQPKMLPVHITYLEMLSPILVMPPVPTRPTVALITANNIPPSFYTYMYELIGKAHHWEERRHMEADRLGKIINNPDCEISILYVEGCPGGFFELNLKKRPDAVEIQYVGLAPEYQGLGLGKWFFATAISAAWRHKPERVTLETNTLDHPAALPLYQILGFSPVAIADKQVSEWK